MLVPHVFKAPLPFALSASTAGLTLAFCCSVSRLMEMRLLDLESPITTHQPSSRFCRKEAAKWGTQSVFSAPTGPRPLPEAESAVGFPESFSQDSTYLWEQRGNYWPGHFLLSLQLHQHNHRSSTGETKRVDSHVSPELFSLYALPSPLQARG